MLRPAIGAQTNCRPFRTLGLCGIAYCSEWQNGFWVAKGKNDDSEHDRRFAADLDGKIKAPPAVALIVVVGVEVTGASREVACRRFFKSSRKSIFAAPAPI
jgi:hypothetical protein